MSAKHKIAAQKRWKGVPKKERSKRMKALALIQVGKKSAKQKREHALMMVQAREAKRKQK